MKRSSAFGSEKVGKKDCLEYEEIPTCWFEETEYKRVVSQGIRCLYLEKVCLELSVSVVKMS